MSHHRADHPLFSSLLTRRQWLQISSLAAFGVGNRTHQAKAAGESAKHTNGFGQAKSVILVFTSGGQSQLDTWDPKPDAPQEVRGDFHSIDTAVPGLRFCEHMPKIAKIADRFTVVRSMSHEDLDHGSAVYLSLTGHYNAIRSGNPPTLPTDAPTLGSIVRKLRPRSRFVNDALHLNGPMQIPRLLSPGQNSGFLGHAYDPLVIGDPRSSQGALPGLDEQEGLAPGRLRNRLTLKESLDDLYRDLDQQRLATDMQGFYRQAADMLSSPQVRDAFNLKKEKTSTRDRYGRHRSGQACLLARRLVEAGVPYINVIWNHMNRGQDLDANETDNYGWDTHNDIFDALRTRLLPRFDESFSALIEDLDQRGLLDQTLVVCLGEFGRAPQIALEAKFAGASPGRKHWPGVYSVVLAGAGVQRGAIVGVSDRLGGEPLTDRYGPWDLAATIFHALGINPAGHFTDSSGRPFPIATGTPIYPLYS